MAVSYTWDVFSTVDGYGSFGPERLGRLLEQAGAGPAYCCAPRIRTPRTSGTAGG